MNDTHDAAKTSPMSVLWHYTITALSAKEFPNTHAAFLECTDGSGNYRGFRLGSYPSAQAAEQATAADRVSRTDWRTATEVDLA